MSDTVWHEAAKKLCFEDCSQGVHLDFEAGCCSVCKRWQDCQGFMAYSTPAIAAFDKGGKDE